MSDTLVYGVCVCVSGTLLSINVTAPCVSFPMTPSSERLAATSVFIWVRVLIQTMGLNEVEGLRSLLGHSVYKGFTQSSNPEHVKSCVLCNVTVTTWP